jgi:hypothetical protein
LEWGGGDRDPVFLILDARALCQSYLGDVRAKGHRHLRFPGQFIKWRIVALSPVAIFRQVYFVAAVTRFRRSGTELRHEGVRSRRCVGPVAAENKRGGNECRLVVVMTGY